MNIVLKRHSICFGLGISTVLLTLLSPLSASVLMFDFGPTSPTGASLTTSPYHAANPAFTSTSWNIVNGTDGANMPDVASGLQYADSTSATGVGFTWGVSSGASITTIDLNVKPTRSSALGGTGIYASPSVARDGIFTNTNANLGFQITGLAAGIYEVYVLARNTNSSSNHTSTAYAGAGTAGMNFDYSGYTSSVNSFTGSPDSTGWIEGSNYHRLTVTLGTGQALNIVSDFSGGESRSFLNAIQVVQIPEPSVFAVMSVTLVPLLSRRRRPQA